MKAYIKPAITSVLVNVTNALLGTSEFAPKSGSGGGNKGNYTGSGQLSNEGEVTSGSIWDEEE